MVWAPITTRQVLNPIIMVSSMNTAKEIVVDLALNCCSSEDMTSGRLPSWLPSSLTGRNCFSGAKQTHPFSRHQYEQRTLHMHIPVACSNVGSAVSSRQSKSWRDC